MGGLLPLAVKGLVVAAALAGTGTAAVELKDVAVTDRPVVKPQTAQPGSAASRATPSKPTPTSAWAQAPTRQGSGLRATTRARPRIRSSGIVEAHPGTPALLTPRPSGADEVAAAPSPRTAANPPATTAPPRTPEERAKARLARLADEIRRVIANAQALAAGGTQNALSLATAMLQRTLGSLLTSIERVLAPLGLKLDSPATTSATTSRTGLASLIAPVRGLLDSVRARCSGCSAAADRPAF